jgi:hypothetical protein
MHPITPIRRMTRLSGMGAMRHMSCHQPAAALDARRGAVNTELAEGASEMNRATPSLLSANGAAPCQPRATPWECHAPHYRGLKARPNRHADETGFQPSRNIGPVTQGAAPGWYEAGALPLRMATHIRLDASRGAVSRKPVERPKGDAVSLSNGGLLA